MTLNRFQFFVEIPHESLKCLVFVPISIGKRVQPGMKVEVSPSTVSRENYGYIVGEVAEVSDYPMTRDSLMGCLRNETLVNRFLNENAPILVSVKLQEDPGTQSGYKWSTGSGPNIRITNETLCSARIIAGEIKLNSFFLPNK